MNSSGLDKAAYDLAKDLFVRSDAYKGITCELLEKYLHLDKMTRPRTVADPSTRYLSQRRAPMESGCDRLSIGEG